MGVGRCSMSSRRRIRRRRNREGLLGAAGGENANRTVRSAGFTVDVDFLFSRAPLQQVFHQGWLLGVVGGADTQLSSVCSGLCADGGVFLRLAAATGFADEVGGAVGDSVVYWDHPLLVSPGWLSVYQSRGRVSHHVVVHVGVADHVG